MDNGLAAAGDGTDEMTPTTHGREMPLDARLRKRLEAALSVVDDHGTTGPRLADDAKRLWSRLCKFLAMGLVLRGQGGREEAALELASFALQLPLRRPRTLGTGRPGRSTLRDRCEEAAELLILELGDLTGEGLLDESLLDHATRVLRETPHRSPMLDEARLLADAVNLDDFGVIGLAQQVLQLARLGDGVTQLADGLEKREQYGYWEARLKDGFHFEPVRELARTRLQHARQAAALLRAELAEDG